MARFLSRLIRNQSGGAAVEFGLIAPALIAVVLGLSQVGGVVYHRHAMHKAVNAGAQALMTSGANAAAVRAVALEAWPNRGAGADVVVEEYCTCAAVRHACTTVCADSSYPQAFTKISASTTMTGPTGQQTLATSELVRTR
jgi:Flp pilus assembly protein TadG